MKAEIAQVKEEGDSIGGTIACTVEDLPAGLGAPIFGGMENRLATLAFSIPAVRGIAFGAGFSSASMRGSEHNDSYYMDGNAVRTRTNNHGGILGGITTGMPLDFTLAIKPTPSIALQQESVDLARCESNEIAVQGRHDPCIVPRAVPVVEAIAALVVYDAILEG